MIALIKRLFTFLMGSSWEEPYIDRDDDLVTDLGIIAEPVIEVKKPENYGFDCFIADMDTVLYREIPGNYELLEL